ncbi:MAG: sugar ABC transporter permease [Chloroflexota bacterium]|nr:sugar ABC transporter permease [Chloroflexota bacterium]
MTTASTLSSTASSRPKRPLLGRLTPLWLLLPAMIVLLVIQVYPTIYSIYLSFQRQRRGGFEFVGLTNFELLLNNSDFRESLARTVTFSGWYVVLTVSLGLLIALLINRRLKFTGWYLVVIFIPWVLSDVVAGTIWRWMFLEDYGLLQAWLRPIFGDSIYITPSGAMGIVILASVWRAVAFTVVLFLGALQTVSNEVLESSSLDGANRFQRFFYVIFPLIRPTFLIAVLLTSIRSVNSVGLILATTKGGPGTSTETASVFLYDVTWGQGNFARGAAVSVLLFAINIVLTVVYLRLVTRRGEA